MGATSKRWSRSLMVVAGFLLVVGASGPRATADEEKNPLRAELLKLNNATTEDLQNARLRALIKDRTKAKKAVAEAAKMMKEAKDQKPFNYNGSLIIGKVAQVVKDYDNAEKFYEYEAELANKVKSGP